MKITKSPVMAACGRVSEEELGLINAYARRELTAEEVFTFAVVLCDNDVDRDLERFSEKTLGELGALFVGKTGISDHEWKSGNQVARIYRTEVVRDEARKTVTGEDYVCLKAWAYMLRSERNAGLIGEIEAGIKKETSVGCSVGRCVCSICGEELGTGACAHVKGQEYGGRLCYATLEDARDAYEWSFVAVPAQRGAGVTKALELSGGTGGLSEGRGEADLVKQLEALRREAELGRRYLAGLRDEVKRLALLCDRELYDGLKGSVGAMDEAALLAVKSAFEKRLAEKLPIRIQLPGVGEVTRFDGGEYKI